MPRIITYTHGSTNPSTRMPRSLLGRFRAGETISALADDYGMPSEQVEWGIELAAWREVAEGLPKGRQAKVLGAMEATLSALHRTFGLIFRDGLKYERETWHAQETLCQIAADQDETMRELAEAESSHTPDAGK